MNTDSLNKPDPMAEDILQIYSDSVNNKPSNVGGIHSLSWQNYFIEQVAAYTTNKIIDARISSLKRFSHIPAPHDEEWSEDYQKGVEHGVLLSQQKLRFEIQRLKALNHRKDD